MAVAVHCRNVDDGLKGRRKKRKKDGLDTRRRNYVNLF
jgi:hypothetical protein